MCARSRAEAISIKVAITDRDRRSPHAAKYPVLIVDKSYGVYCQAALVQPDARAVHVGHAGACQGKVSHCRVITLNDKKSFSQARLVGDDYTGTRTFNHEVVGSPYCAV